MKNFTVLYLKLIMETAGKLAAIGWTISSVGDLLMEVARRWAFGSLDRLAQLESEVQ